MISAPLIVHARLQWMRLIALRGAATPTVVQLLGTQDELVAPDDAIDFAVQEGGANYIYAELPHTSHGNACVFRQTAKDPDGIAGAERRRRFLIALTGNADALASLHIERGYLDDSLPPPADRSVTKVAFVVHGIRDDGYWTRKIAQRIRERVASTPDTAGTWRTVTSSYGYFAILPFVLPCVRREKVEWLMDRPGRRGVRRLLPAGEFAELPPGQVCLRLARRRAGGDAMAGHRRLHRDRPVPTGWLPAPADATLQRGGPLL